MRPDNDVEGSRLSLLYFILQGVKSVLQGFKEYLGIKMTRRSKVLYLSVLVVWVVYVVMLFTTPTPKNNVLHLSDLSLFFIRLSVAVAYLITWMAATYAFIKIDRYSHSIKNSKEAQGFQLLSYSVFILIVSLLFATLISSINSHISSSHGQVAAIVVITNYCYVFPFLAAFWFFWNGSNLLLKRVKGSLSLTPTVILSAVLIGFMYLWLNLIFTNPLRNSSVAPGIPSTYYLSDSLIVLTIILPSFAAWVLSIATALNIGTYAQKVNGLIYRKAIVALAWGTSSVILGSVFLQGLQSLGSIRLIKLGLVKLLLLIYVFLALQLIGYIYMALGAKRLTKIETV